MKTPPFTLRAALAALAGASVAAVAVAQTAAPDIAQTLIQAQLQALRARTGDADAAAKGVAGLEAATAAHGGSAPLWAALGNAHITRASLAMTPGGEARLAAQDGFRKAAVAYDTALRLDPDNVMALSGRGTLLTAMAGLMQRPEFVVRGRAEMDRAIQLAPTATAPRLNRAFSALARPPETRDDAVAIEDLRFLAAVADRSQPGDYIHLLLGDLYYETGRHELAREQYETAARPGAKAEPEARERLAQLPTRAVPAAAIRRLRDATGKNCALCHGG